MVMFMELKYLKKILFSLNMTSGIIFLALLLNGYFNFYFLVINVVVLISNVILNSKKNEKNENISSNNYKQEKVLQHDYKNNNSIKVRNLSNVKKKVKKKY